MAILSETAVSNVNEFANNLLSAQRRIDNILSGTEREIAKREPVIGIAHRRMPDGSIHSYVPNPKATNAFTDNLLSARRRIAQVLQKAGM